MKNIDCYEEKKLTALLRNDFPDACRKTDEMMNKLGFEDEDDAYFIWLETFADITNELIHQRLQTEVEAHLNFFSRQFEIGSESIKNYIDVSYTENLMWNLDTEDKKWAWRLFPENIKNLYINMWGENSIHRSSSILKK